MKKFLLLCGLFAMAMVTFAQETKKVAILEVVDKEGKISYSTKLILRTNLAKAITNVPGYEAYDRTDIDAIMQEQDFQRTGLVNEDQIKRLGEMTGAQYVLVAEAVQVDADHLFITAKLLDVETARTEKTDNQMIGSSADVIQNGCQTLASKFFQAQKVSIPLLIKKKNNLYEYETKTLDKKAYEQFIKNSPKAYAQYQKGKTLVKAGWGTLAVGVVLTGIGGTLWGIGETNSSNYYNQIYPLNRELYSYEYEVSSERKKELETQIAALQKARKEDPLVYGLIDSGVALTVVGASTVCFVSIPLFSAGSIKQKNAYKVYNREKLQLTESMSLKLLAWSNGLGLALNF